jgi:hypothetical protein
MNTRLVLPLSAAPALGWSGEAQALIIDLAPQTGSFGPSYTSAVEEHLRFWGQ